MLDFTQDEVAMLVQDGYTPGFMMDLQEGDLVAIPPPTRKNFQGDPVPVKSLTVIRILKSDASYFDETLDQIVPHTVVNFIGMNLDNLPEHCAYGNMYPCFIKRIKSENS